jgi:hypothetical protein
MPWVISPCGRGWRRWQSYRRKVISSRSLYGADLLAIRGEKPASGNGGGEGARLLG